MSYFIDQATGFRVQVTRKRISHIYLRVKEGKQVEVTAPASSSQAYIASFVASKAAWLLKHMERVPEKKEYHYIHGEVHQILGTPYRLEVSFGKRNGFVLSNGHLLLTVASEKTDRRRVYAEGMKKILLPLLEEMIRHWAPLMKVHPGGVSCRVLKSRWGSCQVKTGDLCFALDLVTKPKRCIEAVVVHELNHLLEKGHTPRFHRLMAHWLLDYKDRERLLRELPRELI